MLSIRTTLLAFVLSASIAMPLLLHAEDMEADKQCPPGGTVGQKCKDTTSGYTTQGHCTHINECKADSWPKSDQKPEQQKPPPIPQIDSEPFPRVEYASSTASSIPSDIIYAAYTEATLNAPKSETATTTPQIQFVNIKGIEYLVTPDEVLRVGDGLSTAGTTSKLYEAVFQTFAGLSPYTQNTYDKTQNTPRFASAKNPSATFIFDADASSTENSSSQTGFRRLATFAVENAPGIGIIGILLLIPLSYALYRYLTDKASQEEFFG